MSRLFATYLMNTNGVSPDQLASVFENEPMRIRYFKNEKVFELTVFDFYSYVRDRSSREFFKVKIAGPDLLRMIRVDKIYSEDEKNELYYHKLLTVHEQMDLDDDTYWGISILQYFFHISSALMKRAEKQWHLFKLYRVNTKWIDIPKRLLHSRGGRPVGSLTGLDEADLQNLENREAIIRNCVEKDRYIEYMELSKLLVRTRERTECGVVLTITGAKWKFYIMRYQWKVSCGYKERDKEYEKKLVEKNKEYGIFKELNFGEI